MAQELVYDPETGQMLTPYQVQMKTLASKQQLNRELDSGKTVDTTNDVGQGVVESGQVTQEDFDESRQEAEGDGVGKSTGMGAAQGAYAAMKEQGGVASKAGAGMMAMGGATANPYLVGAGLATAAVGSIQEGKRKERQNRYLAEVQKFNARQEALQKMAQIGQGLKA